MTLMGATQRESGKNKMVFWTSCKQKMESEAGTLKYAQDIENMLEDAKI